MYRCLKFTLLALGLLTSARTLFGADRLLISPGELPGPGPEPLAEAAARPETLRRPNILWLIGEDIGPEALSCSGNPQTATPNLDRLAAEGVRYTRAYAGMVCSPSRSSFMTGMYAVSIGAQNHRTLDKKPLPLGVRLLTDWFRDSGYFTANVVRFPEGVAVKGTGKTDWNFKATNAFDTKDWSELKTHQPFFAQVNFSETHRPYHAPAQADPARVRIPPYYPDHPVTRKDMAQYLDSARELDREVGLVLRQLAQDGLADNTIVLFFGDNGASLVRAKQFCYEEGFHVPMILRWPKGLPAPSQLQPGGLDERLIDVIDLAPTMLALAGVPKPARMQGGIFLGERAEPAREYIFGARDRCDETIMKIRAVRDGRYRYIRNLTPEVPFLAPNKYKEEQYPVWNLLKALHAEGRLTPAQECLCQPRMPEEELYDLESDPDEIHNLAGSSEAAHQTERQKLRRVLEQWMAETAPEAVRLSLQPPQKRQ